MKRGSNDEITVLTQQQKDRILDFAKRMVFKGYEKLTQRRKDRLWHDVEWFLSDALEEGHWGWETGGTEETFSMCDWITERFEKDQFPSGRWEKKVCDYGEDPKYFRMLSATCRAAMDVVGEAGGGVLGWTVGDMKRMYDGQLPDWFDIDWKNEENGVVKLQNEPDEAGVWL
jgi:hypothetical protein